MNITRIKEMFIIFIKLNLRKRQISYKRVTSLQTLKIKTTVKKKKKKRATLKTISFLLQFFLWIGP